MYQRDVTELFKVLMEQFPIVTIMGPRQSGKTTLVRKTYPKKAYFNLEEPDTRALILEDPRKLFHQHPEGIILDEIQRAPELLSYMQSIVDENQTPGQYILTGSHQLQLHEAITQSLAGRTALIELYPLSLHELSEHITEKSLDELLIDGFFPAVYAKNIPATTLHRNYVKTYIERDVRQIIAVKDLDSFHRFVQLCAGRVGSVLNLESLSNDVGVSNNTIKNWMSALQASFIIYRLRPYYENFGKRIIKAPKLYFTDVGQVSYLLGLETAVQVARERLRGALFENLVLLELIKTYTNRGKEPHLYYYRDNHQNEVDIILKARNALIPIEVKSTSTYSSALLQNLKFYQALVGERMPFGFLVYAGEKEQQIGNFYLVNYKNVHQIYDMIQGI